MTPRSSRWTAPHMVAPTLLALGLFLTIFTQPLTGQCPLTCRSQTNLSLDLAGEGTFTPQNGLMNPPASCLPDYSVTLYTPQGDSLGDQVSCDQLGLNLTFKVTYEPTGNHCWGQVRIEDKLAPELTCANDTVYCTSSTDPAEAGPRQATDNCTTDPEILLNYELVEAIPCGDPNNLIQRIERRWLARDEEGNESSICTQFILVERATLPDVSFPVDLVGQNALDCTATDFSPAVTGIPTVKGQPTAPLCKVLFDHQDDTLDICPGSVLIAREWTAIDCCTNLTITETQFIELADTTAPTITCPADLTVSTKEDTCTADILLPEASASDNCSPGVEIVVTTSWGGNGLGPYLDRPVGGYVITYTASDSCGNTNSCTMDLVVKDLVPPVALCYLPVIAYLDTLGLDTVVVADVDAGSSDNCTMSMGEIKLMGEPDSLYRQAIGVDCGFLGVDTMILLRMTDCWDNISICMTPLVVLDTMPPQLECPDDLTLSCASFANYPGIGDVPVPIDGCGLDTLFFTDSLDLNDCNTGQIFRTWTAADPGGAATTCLQVLTLIDDTEPIIIWPDDTTIDCAEPLDPVFAGAPEVSDDCSLLAVGFQDSVVVAPGCDTLFRIWRVKDWCTDYDSSYVQRIDLTDDIPVVEIDCPDDITVYVDETCLATVALDTVVAFDECGHFITVTNDSPFADENGADASGIYPVGTFPITFTISDACNDITCGFALSVRDTTPPTLETQPLIACIGADSTFILDPSDMVDTTWDWCSSVTLSATPDTFDCDDIMQSIPVTITATDTSGNSISLVDTLFLENCDVCIKSVADGGVQLTGKVVRWDGQPIPDVPIEFDLGLVSHWTNSGPDGTYESPVYPPGITLEVRAHPVPGDLEGLTTADILAIAGHLTEEAPLLLLEQWLAADLNRSGTISIADLVRLRRSILQQIGGLQAGFWRFFPQSLLTDPLTDEPAPNAWGGYFRLDSITNELPSLSFQGVKAGDVDLSSHPAHKQRPTPDFRALQLHGLPPSVQRGEQIHIHVEGVTPDRMVGFQLALRYAPHDVQFLGIDPGPELEVSSEHLATDPIGGWLRCSWDQMLIPVTNTRGEWFTIHFRAKRDLSTDDWLWLDEADLPAEMYFSTTEKARLVLERPEPVEAGSLSDILLPVTPNPVTSSARIPFQLSKEGAVTFVLYHPNGTIVWQHRDQLPAGYHEVSLDGAILPGAGHYHLEMRTASAVQIVPLVFHPRN